MAGSSAAFAADRPEMHASNYNILTDGDHNARPLKRPRLSSEAIAGIAVQCAQDDTALDVDYMILDYLANQTITACFASKDPDSSSSFLSSSSSATNAFLAIFRARYPAHKVDPELRLRILLLRLTVLFTQRLTSNPSTPQPVDLRELRATNLQRAQDWLNKASINPAPVLQCELTEQQLESNRAHVLEQLDVPAEDENYEDAFYGTSACITLLDLLPSFMEISAARNAMNNSNLSERWMRLACEWMLQACLEQVLVLGANRADLVDEAFAWGYTNRNSDKSSGIEQNTMQNEAEDEINLMFEDEDYESEIDGWQDVKLEFLRQTYTGTPDTGYDAESLHATTTHLQRLAAKYQIATFESAVLEFLVVMSQSMPKPVLAQLETGKLDGMTEDETRNFLASCGVEIAGFFQHAKKAV